MNAEAAGSAALIRILSGNTRKAGTESSSDWGDPMFKVGDYVIFVPDGTKGTVMEAADGRYHVVWEDHFASWEAVELLEKINA